MKVMKTLLAGSFVALAAPAFAAETAATLTDAQRDEVRSLVKEVLADADSRSTLASGATAGIGSDGKVFLRSEDDRFLMNIGGAVQTRYMWHNGNGSPSRSGDYVQGFDLSYTSVNLTGHIGGGASQVGYRVQFTRWATGNVGIEQAYAILPIADRWSVKAGKFYLPYSRETLIAPTSQVTVANGSNANGFFGMGRAVGAQLEYASDTLRTRGAVSNGGNSEDSTAFPNYRNHFAVTGRADFLIASNDKTGMHQFNDNFAARGSSKVNGLLLGGAAYFEEPDHSSLAAPSVRGYEVEHQYGATADATFKFANLAFFGAGYVAYDRLNQNNGYKAPVPWGVVAQVDVGVTNEIDVFGQWNLVNNTTVQQGQLFQTFVAGANYHINNHVRLTGDVVWVYSGTGAYTSLTPGASSTPGAGAAAGLGNGTENEVAARLQLQVSF